MRENKSFRMKAIIIASIVAVAVVASIVATYPANVTAQNSKALTPKATIAKGHATQVLKDISLAQIMENSSGNRLDRADPEKLVYDSGRVFLTLHYGKKNDLETVAVTVRNASPQAITVDGLLITGYLHGPSNRPDIAVQALYRPVISDPYDAVGATTTVPEVIPAGQSLTAYIQGTFNLDGYGATACYSYDTSSPETHYCIPLPDVKWIK